MDLHQGLSRTPRGLKTALTLMHKHINFLGRYAFSLPEPIAKGRLRQLRAPSFAADFRTAL
jgi:hypothetical protein